MDYWRIYCKNGSNSEAIVKLRQNSTKNMGEIFKGVDLEFGAPTSVPKMRLIQANGMDAKEFGKEVL